MLIWIQWPGSRTRVILWTHRRAGCFCMQATAAAASFWSCILCLCSLCAFHPGYGLQKFQVHRCELVRWYAVVGLPLPRLCYKPNTDNVWRKLYTHSDQLAFTIMAKAEVTVASVQKISPLVTGMKPGALRCDILLQKALKLTYEQM